METLGSGRIGMHRDVRKKIRNELLAAVIDKYMKKAEEMIAIKNKAGTTALDLAKNDTIKTMLNLDNQKSRESLRKAIEAYIKRSIFFNAA